MPIFTGPPRPLSERSRGDLIIDLLWYGILMSVMSGMPLVCSLVALVRGVYLPIAFLAPIGVGVLYLEVVILRSIVQELRRRKSGP